MNGNISVKSKPNQGSIFEIELNNVEVFEKEIESQISTNLINNIKFEKASILVCDDNKTNRLLLNHLLAKLNLEIHESQNGKEALEMVEKIKPNLILMDLRMPEMNGYEATTILKMNEKTKNIPVIAISASVNIVEKKENYINLFNDFILKPFKIEKLIEVLNKYLVIKE